MFSRKGQPCAPGKLTRSKWPTGSGLLFLALLHPHAGVCAPDLCQHALSVGGGCACACPWMAGSPGLQGSSWLKQETHGSPPSEIREDLKTQ